MIGNILWNLIIGLISGLLSYTFSTMNDNLVLTSLIRGIIVFIVMFILTFLFRWLLALATIDMNSAEEDKIDELPATGSQIDLTTPNEDVQLPELSAEQTDHEAHEQDQQQDSSSSFQPFHPPRVIRTESVPERTPDPKTAAQAIRRLTED